MTTVTPLKTALWCAGTLLCLTATITETKAADPILPNVQFARLQNALNTFYDIRQKGGWPQIQAGKKYYMLHQSDPVIKQIKQRLRVSGDFHSADTSRIFTEELALAVKQVQKRFGYTSNGVVDAQLIRQLNVPVDKRIEQLQVNLERLSAAPAHGPGTHLVANIPEFKLHVYEGDQQVFDMDIVVGKESSKTVIFNDEMKYIVFNPTWNVPPSIVRNEILPAMRKSSTYLSRNGYVRAGTENGLPVIKQLPGEQNSLGKVKFVFPNSHNIYFHDTPAKSLFTLRKRAFSHGCIRLAEPEKLAAYLLRNKAGWSEDKVWDALISGKEQPVTLPSPVPVSITYYTAWVDGQGLVHFREDIYGHDKQTAQQLAGRTPGQTSMNSQALR